MDAQTLYLVAGTVSTLLFISSSVPMLLKAAKTKNLASYSLSNMALNNVGNLVYWLYISQLPFGPIWLMHGFYTLTSGMMLIWYLRYQQPSITSQRPTFRARVAAEDSLTC